MSGNATPTGVSMRVVQASQYAVLCFAAARYSSAPALLPKTKKYNDIYIQERQHASVEGRYARCRKVAGEHISVVFAAAIRCCALEVIRFAGGGIWQACIGRYTHIYREEEYAIPTLSHERHIVEGVCVKGWRGACSPARAARARHARARVAGAAQPRNAVVIQFRVR